MSDHLPIVADFQSTAFISSSSSLTQDETLVPINPSTGAIQFYLDSPEPATWQIQIVDLSGKVQFSRQFSAETGRQHYQFESPMALGYYILELQNQQNGQKLAKALLIR